MQFGVVNLFPPPSTALAMMRRAEELDFDYFWVTDSHVIWNECYSLLGWLVGQSVKDRIRFGTMVTNPVSRDPITIASAFATLNQITTGRMACGIGRGDSAVRVLARRPSTVAAATEAIEMIRALGSGRPMDIDGTRVQIEWAGGELPVYVAAYGPKMLEMAGRVGDGVIIENVDRNFIKWALEHVRRGARSAGRDPGKLAVICSTASYISTDLAVAREEVRSFGALVGNHVAEVLRNTGSDGIPPAWSDFINDRNDYDYLQHVKSHTDQSKYVPDSILDELCLIGTASQCTEKLAELAALGVTHVNLYGQVNDFGGLMQTYSREIIPSVRAAIGH